MTATRIGSRSTTGVPDQIGTLVIASLGLFMTALDTLVVTIAAAQRGLRYRDVPLLPVSSGRCCRSALRRVTGRERPANRAGPAEGSRS